MSHFHFFLSFIIFISCSHSFIIFDSVLIQVQNQGWNYLTTLADGSVILVLLDAFNNPLKFMIYDADGTFLRSTRRPQVKFGSFYSILALQNGNFVFVFKTEMLTIVFEIYDNFLNLIKEETTVRYPDTSTNDITDELFFPTVFNLNNNGFGIIYQKDGSTLHINFYDQDGNFASNSAEIFPGSGLRSIYTQALQMPNDNILYLYQKISVCGLSFFSSLKSNNEELCTLDPLNCVYDETTFINIQMMKNGMALIAWLNEYTLEAYFTILDELCTRIKSETKLGDAIENPQIECLENGVCVSIYLKNGDNNIHQIVLRIFNSNTNTFGEEILVTTTESHDYMISAYSNSNFLIVWTNMITRQVVGKVYSLDCLLYLGEECQACANPKVFSKGNLACVTPLEGCVEYSANGKCLCYTILTVDGICAQLILGCSAYSSDGKCSICDSQLILTSDKTACVPEIEFCLTYANDGKCLSCMENHRLILENMECGPIIPGCVLYSNDEKLCLRCKNHKKPIEHGLVCRGGIIKYCTIYSSDGNCATCISPKVLSVAKTSCVQPIQDCLRYKDNGQCLACGSNKIFSSNKKKCFTAIDGCIKYGSDSKCIHCIRGTKLSNDKLSCV